MVFLFTIPNSDHHRLEIISLKAESRANSGIYITRISTEKAPQNSHNILSQDLISRVKLFARQIVRMVAEVGSEPTTFRL